MKSRIVMFVVALALWCLLNWEPGLQTLIIGVVVSVIVAVLMGSLFKAGPTMFRKPVRIVYFFFWYLPVFLWELVKANFDVALRIIHPKLNIEPGIVKIRTNLKTDAGITFLANSITLTPGTMTVDVDQERGYLYIHWIKVRGRDIESATKAIGGRFEPILRKIFEEVEVSP
jgi:multicomponent Na+:H+ antiporter subunit E